MDGIRAVLALNLIIAVLALVLVNQPRAGRYQGLISEDHKPYVLDTKTGVICYSPSAFVNTSDKVVCTEAKAK